MVAGHDPYILLGRCVYPVHCIHVLFLDGLLGVAMKIYWVVYVDKGNCEIASYTVAGKNFTEAMKAADRMYFDNLHDPSEVFTIRIERLEDET